MSDNSSDEENKYSDLEDGEIQQQSTTTATKISQKLLNKNLKNIKNQRKEFYLNAKEEYEVISCQLPYQFHHITVLEFGEIKSNKNFYTKTKIYPVGYKCEVTIKSSNTIIVVEIVDMDDQLEFLVTLKSSNRVFMASSEEDIFKKYADDPNDRYSIFNLDIELLIEGMEGVLDCEDYIFHGERGYGETYTTDEEYRNTTTKLSLKESRAIRNRNRQSTKSMTTEELKQLAENKKKEQKEEAERKKKQAAEAKAQRLEAKANERKRKEDEKYSKDIEKEQNKRVRDQKKKEEKVKSSFRREVMNDINRNRRDAALQVIQYFDDEQESLDVTSMSNVNIPENLSSSSNSSLLNTFFTNLPTLKEQLHLKSDSDTSRLIDVVSFLHSMRSLLRISSENYTLEYFNSKVLGNFTEKSQNLPVESNSRSLQESNHTVSIPVDETVSHNEPDTTTNMEMDIVKEEETSNSVALAESVLVSDPHLKEESSEAEAEFEDTSVHHPAFVFEQDEIELDRIQLNLIRVVLDDLHQLFGLVERDEKRNSKIPRFPLNQLTWPEIARMIIISSMGKELSRSEDEVINLLRGSKQSHFKQAKNVIRLIRNRLALRYSSTSNDQLTKSVAVDEILPASTSDLLWSFKSSGIDMTAPILTNSMEMENMYDFTSDQEIISAVEEAANDDVNYSEEYRRCFKVWLRIANYSQAKNFMWDIDTNIYPDYYLVIKRPLTFSQVALNLLKKSYLTSSQFGEVASAFYCDMKQVLLNCFTYNTEAIALVSQAQRLLQALHRHVDRWIFSSSAPPLYTCSDQFCLYTSTPIMSNPNHHVSIKCGRCLALFSIDALHAHQKEEAVILPTQDQVHGSDEWYCMYCLREDTVVRDQFRNQVRPDHFLDEWGPSCLVPWMFNINIGNVLEPLLKSSPQIQSMMEALHILSCPSKTSLLQQNPTDVNTWSFQERLSILSAICDVLKGHEISFQYLHKIYSECITLSKMAFREPFHEGDFMNQVLKISGPEGVVLARAMLDGSELAVVEEETIKQSVIEGRCLVCKESTYEDDCDGKRVLLCDGCNAETHLDCVGFSSIPKGAWYCPPCKQRLDSKFESDGYMSQLDDIQDLCNKEEEHRLINEEIFFRESEQVPGKKNELMCSYCGLTELQLCSPMVYGQSRQEFQAHMKYSTQAVVNDIIPDQEATIVKFSLLKQEQKAPEPPLPYFPLFNEKNSKKLRGGRHLVSPIVHEICAYRMFAARVQRSKHEARKRRRLVAEKVAMMSGISTQPIGFDDEGRCYWQFPHISTLFISPRANRDHEQDKEALRRQINSDFQESRLDSSAADNWYAISDSKEITTLIESLGPSAAEQHLKKSLSLRFAEMNSSTHRQGAESKVDSENEISPATGTIEDKESVSDNQDSIKTSKRDKPERESVKRKGEGKPVALKLIPEKGATMQSTFVIKEENVFGNRENDGDDDYSSDDDESYLEYFSFAKPARYYAIAFVDCYDKVVKQDKSSRVTIVFQIQKEGLAHSIAETPLSEPWSDGMYYFSTLSFKRSGKYTISFFAEGAQLSHLQPLVFVVNVFANSVVSGPSSALRRLRAQEYIDHPDRHVTYKRRELIQLLTNSDDEFSAIKTALLTIYLALPLGSLIMSEDDDSGLDTFSQVATGAGWNGQLDTLWRNCVVETRSSTVLMECTLLLECYISKNWFMSPANRLISSLPNPHFAIRCVTNSSIALRLFCLDKCLGYDRVQAKSKSGGSITVSQATSRKSRSNGRSDIPQDVLAEYTARPKRAAMAKAREALSETVKFHFDEDSDNEGGSRRNLRTRPARPEWNCSECGTTNDERNRSCSECGGRKRAASVVTTTHLSRAERLASRKRALYGSDESSADTNSSSDEERDDNSDDEPRASRRKHTTSNLEAHSLRKRSRVSYREAEEDDEGDEDSTENGNYSTRGSNKRGRDNKSSHSDDYSEYIPPTPLDIDALLVTRKSEIGDMDPSEDIPYALLTILKKIQDDPESIPFWEPVDTTIYTDYRDKVAEPMDLNSIIRRVEVGFYGNEYEDFAKDIRQIWINCQIYNAEGSPIYASSQRLSEYFEILYSKFLKFIESKSSMEGNSSQVDPASSNHIPSDGM